MDGRISNLAQVASLRRYTLTEGAGKGLDVIDCDNGRIRFLLNVDKALDVMQLYHEGQNMSFISKNGFVKRELPFDNRFEGGMLYTCGLDNIGAHEGFELHGKLHCTPAEILRAEVDEQGITVEAVIRCTEMAGKNLVIRRKITAAVGAASMEIEDVLCNEGYRTEKYCLLYHVNMGYPMLDEGARVMADVERCTPRNPWSRENLATVFEGLAPVDNRDECCYFIKLRKPTVDFVNEKLGKKFNLTYSADTLPCFVEWHSMASGDYAIGLEPCTAELDDTFAYSEIKAGERITFRLTMGVEALSK
jgi:hypothetical protein